MRAYSTAEIAKKVGISKLTLKRWLYAGEVREPKHVSVGRLSVRIWTTGDLERVRKYKEANYRKGRGRKKKAATP